MKKYFFVFLLYFVFGLFLIAVVHFYPEFQYMLSYRLSSIQEESAFLLGQVTVATALCFSFSITLLPCIIWDFFHRKSSGSAPDENIKNNNNLEENEK